MDNNMNNGWNNQPQNNGQNNGWNNQPQNNGWNTQQYGQPPKKQMSTNEILALVSMILGILSIIVSSICCCITGSIGLLILSPVPLAGLILGIISYSKLKKEPVILENSGKKNSYFVFALVGIITSAVAIALIIVMSILMALGIGAALMSEYTYM